MKKFIITLLLVTIVFWGNCLNVNAAHSHSDSCYTIQGAHTHIGGTSSQGGCYTEPVVCNGTITPISEYVSCNRSKGA